MISQKYLYKFLHEINMSYGDIINIVMLCVYIPYCGLV